VKPELVDGMIDDVVETFTSIPSHRMVVLGRGGSGKSILAEVLAVGLIKSQWAEDHGQVPVVFKVHTWNPGQQEFVSWLKSELISGPQAVLSSAPADVESAAQLVDEHHILPILDGFDELPTSMQGEALRKLNSSSYVDNALVLTSRPDEYETAIAEARQVLRSSIAIELQDLDLDDLRGYLPLTARVLSVDRKQEAEQRNETAWEPVLSFLQENVDSAHAHRLLEVLSRPLTVFLARMAYGDRSADPGELLDESRFYSVEVLTFHLFGQFASSAKFSPMHKRQSREWLEYLAAKSHQRGYIEIQDYYLYFADIKQFKLFALRRTTTTKYIIQMVLTGSSEKAVLQMRDDLDFTMRVFGKEHILTLVSWSYLLGMLRALGRTEEAREELEAFRVAHEQWRRDPLETRWCKRLNLSLRRKRPLWLTDRLDELEQWISSEPSSRAPHSNFANPVWWVMSEALGERASKNWVDFLLEGFFFMNWPFLRDPQRRG